MKHGTHMIPIPAIGAPWGDCVFRVPSIPPLGSFFWMNSDCKDGTPGIPRAIGPIPGRLFWELDLVDGKPTYVFIGSKKPRRHIYRGTN